MSLPASPPEHPPQLVLGSIVSFDTNEDWQAKIQEIQANANAKTLILHGGRLSNGEIFHSIKDALPQITELVLHDVRTILSAVKVVLSGNDILTTLSFRFIFRIS